MTRTSQKTADSTECRALPRAAVWSLEGAPTTQQQRGQRQVGAPSCDHTFLPSRREACVSPRGEKRVSLLEDSYSRDTRFSPQDTHSSRRDLECFPLGLGECALRRPWHKPHLAHRCVPKQAAMPRVCQENGHVLRSCAYGLVKSHEALCSSGREKNGTEGRQRRPRMKPAAQGNQARQGLNR